MARSGLLKKAVGPTSGLEEGMTRRRPGGGAGRATSNDKPLSIRPEGTSSGHLNVGARGGHASIHRGKLNRFLPPQSQLSIHIRREHDTMVARRDMPANRRVRLLRPALHLATRTVLGRELRTRQITLTAFIAHACIDLQDFMTAKIQSHGSLSTGNCVAVPIVRH